MTGHDNAPPHRCEIHAPGSRGANRSLLILTILSFLILALPLLMGRGGGGRFLPRFLHLLADVFTGPRGVIPELVEIFPYVLAGVLIAGYIRTRRVALKIQAKLRRYGSVSVVVATFVGLISPLCACGTVTTAVGLLFAGVPIAPVMALMVTSPLMSPSTYLITLNDLGPEWTVVRTLAAFLLGIVTGYATLLLCRAGFDRGGIFRDGSIVRGDLHSDDYPDHRLRCTCRERFGNRVASRTGNTFLIFLAKSAETLVSVGKYVIIGVFVGAVVERSIPADWLLRFFGGDDPLNVLWVTLGSVPVFLHQISVSSIISHVRETIPGVLDPRVALAFMIGGPVTAIPTMAIFLSLLRPRFFVLYLVSCLVGTVGIAFLLGSLFFMPGVDFGSPLLRGVSSLPGGGIIFTRSTEDPPPQIMLQGKGGGLLLFSSDDRSGRGGVVIDGNRARLMSVDDGDVQRYVLNVARVLEDHQMISSQAAIRILTPDGRSAGPLCSLLRNRGYRCEEGETQQGDPGAVLSQIWIFPDRSTILTPSFVDRIGRFRDGGGSLLIVPDPLNESVVPLLRRAGAVPVGEEPREAVRVITRRGDLLVPLFRLVSLLEQVKRRPTP